MERTLWEIIEIPQIGSGDIKNKIEFKVPSYFKQLTGIMFSAVDVLYETSLWTTTIGIYGADENNNVIGKVSLHVNGKQINPLQYAVQVHNHDNLKRKYEPLCLHQPLKGGTLIQGYYIDLGTANRYPYTLKIYLKGI